MRARASTFDRSHRSRRSSTLLRRAHLSVMRSRFGWACDARLVRRMTTGLYEITADDVFAVVDALGGAGVAVWLAGGWGVDALLGRQSRRHGDLDVLVDDAPANVDASRRALTGIGLRVVASRPASGLMPGRVVFADASGRSVDLLAVSTERGTFAASEEACSPFVVGEVGGRPVGCVSLAMQLRLHDGIPLSPAARADVAALHRCLREPGTPRRPGPTTVPR